MDNIGVINETCKLAGIERLTPDNVDLNDEKVWKSIRDDTTLIFQWESSSAQAYLKNFMSDKTINIAKEHNKDFSYIKWFSFGNGLIRPGCASFRDDVANGNILVTGFKELDEFLAITFGRVTMQEDIMRFCKQFCGYGDAESDNVRRAIAKKKGTANLLDELHDRFLDYSNKTYGVNKAKLEEIFPPIKQGILDASSYAFSWNHSDSYSAIGYISGYLRYYYPLEFLTAAFNIFTGKEEKITAITEYAKKIGVKIRDIQFGHSKAEYNLDKTTKTIYKGMESIKFMNASVSNKLYELSQTKHYTNFAELLKDFPGDSRQLDVLIKLDYFSEFGTIGELLSIVDIYTAYANRKVLSKDSCALPAETMRQFANETEKQWRVTDGEGLLKYLCANAKPTEFTLSQRLYTEQEYLGYISYRNPSLKFQAYVLDVPSTKFTPRITVYDLSTGQQKVVKAYKNAFAQDPLVKGMIITYATTPKEDSRKDPVTGEWKKCGTYSDWFQFWTIKEYPYKEKK